MIAVDIYFDDLSKEKQEQLLKVYEINSPEEANWDTIPVTTVYVDDED